MGGILAAGLATVTPVYAATATLPEGTTRVAAEGNGHSFLVRSVAMKPGEHEIASQRLYEIFRSAPKSRAPKALAAPGVDLSGSWDVDVEYEAGSARHILVIAAGRNELTGSHQGWAYDASSRGRLPSSIALALCAASRPRAGSEGPRGWEPDRESR